MKIKLLYKIFLQHKHICTDSRNIIKGSIFFALKGNKFNGNKYALDALNKGSEYAIIDEEKYCNNTKTILVKNVLETLQNLARYHRKKLKTPIIGITGSNGKTTSKELIYRVLKTEKKCYATKGNLNNHIGVPLSLLEIKKSHDIAIIEMGANHTKEIENLCKITSPDYGIITNIGSAHLEGFTNLQGVTAAKNELYEAIKMKNGHLFVNADDKLLMKLAKDINSTTYGTKGIIKTTLLKNTPFIIVKFNNKIKSKLIGEYQFDNISLAICVGNYFNISNKNIKIAIENYIPSNNRSQIVKTKTNRIILDAYNANPSSMHAMIKSFYNQEYDNKLCILGDMLELGKYAKNEHNKIITLCEKMKLKYILVGEEFKKINNKAFTNIQELIQSIKKNPIKKHTILIKGSRSITLEKIVDFL